MAISYKYDNEKKMLIVTLEGIIVLEEVDMLYKEIVASTEFHPDVRSIWDFRKADFSLIDINFLNNVISLRKKYPERGNARAAFVADNDLSYGVSRMYEVLSSFELPQNILAFREFSDAEKWILEEKYY